MEEMTHNGLAKLVSFELLTWFLGVVFLGGMAYANIESEVQENAQDIRDIVTDVREARRAQSQKLDEMNSDVTAIREGQAEFKAAIKALAENQQRIIRELERNRSK